MGGLFVWLLKSKLSILQIFILANNFQCSLDKTRPTIIWYYMRWRATVIFCMG